jgi:gliding motility-associated-like protein
MNKILIQIIFCFAGLLICTATVGQDENWTNTLGLERSFIPNYGQFEQHGTDQVKPTVLYAHDGTGEDYLFTKDGVVLEFSDLKQAKKSEAEKEARLERKQQGFYSLKAWQDFENVGHRLAITYDHLSAKWLGNNPDAVLVPSQKKGFTHSYTYIDDTGQTVNKASIDAFEKITYKNMYPNIDVVYEFHPDGGLKYSLIVRPGADLSLVQLHYSKVPQLNSDGTLRISTEFGEVIDHAPFTFYADDHNQTIPSAFSVNGNTVSFDVANYDQQRTIVIDPWTQTPTFNTNWDCVWECETDAAGNSYIIGGVMPLQLLKYNNAGALQWTYNTPYDTTGWLGVFATDDAGNSYVTNGSTAQIQMINTGGALVWDNPSPGGLFGSTEFWNIAFNCDQTKLLVGGTGGVLPPLPYMYDVNMATGNVLNSVQVCGSTIGGFPPNTQEVRAVTATSNEKYYFLTQDTIGYVDQGLNTCTGAVPFHVENGGYNLGYKCENWRYNNTGVEALAYFNDFIYVNRGDRLDKRDFLTAAIVATAPIPAGAFANNFGQNELRNSGIAIDDCGNIYVGSSNAVVKFDQNLSQLATYPTSFVVYDVDITSTGEVIAAGSTGNSGSASRSGSIQSFAAGACSQPVTICCNPSVCPEDPMCDTDAPVSFFTYTPGGTWSSGPGMNVGTGTFDPAVAGPGTYTFVHTLACGSDSVTVTVVSCSAMTVCVETNGDLTVNGGSAPFTWLEPTWVQDCSGCFIGCNFPAGCAVNVLTWTSFGTGVTVTPLVGADSVAVEDLLGNIVYVFDITTLPPCNAICDATITPDGPFCVTDAAVTLGAAQAGGTWGGTGITNTSTGTFDPGAAGAGSWVITYTLGCGDSDTETILVNGQDDPSFAYSSASYCLTDADPLPTITGLGGGAFTIDNSGTVNGGTGEIDLGLSGVGNYIVTYITNGTCPDTATFAITITAGGDATITSSGNYCENEPSDILTATDPGGTWTGPGIINGATGEFDPATATAGTYFILYTIAGSCGDVDSVSITVTAVDDPGFTYAQGSYCTVDPNPIPTITGLGGGNFTIDNGGTIIAGTGEIDLGLSGVGNYIVTYITNGVCPDTATFAITITAGGDATITSSGNYCENEPSDILTATDPGGTWTGSGIINGATGEFDPATATAGTYFILYTIAGSCGDVDSVSITVTAVDDPGFTYAQGSYCTVDPNPIPTITGLGGGAFTVDNSGTINAGTGEIDLGLSGVGNFIVTYITNGVCPDTATFAVTITTGGNATIFPPGAYCEGDPADILTATDPGGTWTGTGITNGTTGEFDPSIATAGTYMITYTIPGSCGDVDSVAITVNAQDNALFNYAQASYCTVDPNPVPTISGTTGGAFSIDNGGVINAGTGEIDLGTSGTGSFVVTYITLGICPDTATFAAIITTGGDATITAPGNFCEGDAPVNLNATDPGGVWTGTGITNGATGLFDPTAATLGTYDIIYTIPGSCGDADTITIVVTAQDDATFSFASTTICLNDVDAIPTITGTPGGTFTISNSGVIDPNTGEIDLGSTPAGNYVVSYQTNGLCPANSVVSITIVDASNPVIDAAGPFCITEAPYTLTVNGGGGNWTGNGVNGTTGVFNPGAAGAGAHTIIYTVGGACGGADTIQIVVSPLPIVDAGADTIIFIGGSASLYGTGGGSYVWSPGADLDCPTCQDPIATPNETTMYYVTVTGPTGCTAIDSVLVTVINEFDVFLPNIFSPDGDGYNDVFYIRGKGIRELEFYIYDRWGQKIFESSSVDVGWDGDINGKPANNGVYVYVVLAKPYDSEEVTELSGNVTLIR